MQLSFHGGAREVTGACYLLDTATEKFLIDCGLFQGTHECVELNFEPFGFDPKKVDALFVTHAHLDHVGRIPKLVKEGFSGKIYSTEPTRDIARIIIEDAMAINRRGNKELYSSTDVEKSFSLWEGISYGSKIETKNSYFVFRDAGHILGSAFIEIRSGGKYLFFTGDLGNSPSELLRPPERFRDIEYLVIESTYGNRAHEGVVERVLKLERAIEDTASSGGTLMIPAFATERTQEILFILNRMLYEHRIPEMPVFVDSPLAIKVTKVFEKYPHFYKDEIQVLFSEHPNLFKFKMLHMSETVEESKRINDVVPPKIVIAGSGMMSGGRILHHARRYLKDPKSILLITGYQPAGSLGRRLVDGEKMVKIFGEDVEVYAQIKKINGFSAHADNPQLFSFVESTRETLKRVFVVQGEETRALHFMQEIKDRLGVEADTPMLHEEFGI